MLVLTRDTLSFNICKSYLSCTSFQKRVDELCFLGRLSGIGVGGCFFEAVVYSLSS